MFKLNFKRGTLIREYREKSRILILYDTGEYIFFDPCQDIREIGSYQDRGKGVIVLQPDYRNGRRVEDRIEEVELTAA